MKKKLLFFVLVSLLVMPSLSFAETSTSTSVKEKNEVKKEKVEQKRETIKDEIEAKKEALKNSIEERRQNALDKIKERVDKFVQNMTERFNAAIERLDTLASRIDSRIAKLKEAKIDATKAERLMATAKTKITVAKTSVSGLTGAISDTASTTASVKEEFKAIKDQIEKAKNDIKAAHAALVDVVNNLKPGQEKLDKLEKISSKESGRETNCVDGGSNWYFDKQFISLQDLELDKRVIAKTSQCEKIIYSIYKDGLSKVVSKEKFDEFIQNYNINCNNCLVYVRRASGQNIGYYDYTTGKEIKKD